ncbi:uncharacterized protein I303_105438 [Kwoniella dejecticola CBS 10117]|uniref:Uncharacterized protein n=1 Tax=Kwoniella dejecticola CBS 10117 TaxID=1296121 RepID=A0A1A6A2J2_9TREE|nr:uncharacterized protein I303_05121 [Kwoniella dejecticola CBS 10117]OBR84264.1 hypothetical protein I303_05121 [Kwoniella dejecticola CBS 10117]
MPVTLTDLPAELLFQIHQLAQNPFLPRTTRYLHSLFHQPSPHYAATYLLNLYSTFGPDEILVRSLRHPICDVGVAQEIRRMWDRRRGYIEASHKPAGDNVASVKTGSSSSSSSSPLLSPSSTKTPTRLIARPRKSRSPSPTSARQSPPEPTAPPLTCCELPRRLFRDPPDLLQPIHPLIKYIFDTYSPSPNSHKGYPLFRAILTSNYDLVSFLLAQGADPSIRDSFALEIAISMKDLKMVKLLVERDAFHGTPATPSPAKDGVKKGKKVKLGDRIEIGTKMVERAIEKGAKEIINYFVYEKKVMPPLHSIMNIGKTERSTSTRNHKTVQAQKRKKPSRPSLSNKAKA